MFQQLFYFWRFGNGTNFDFFISEQGGARPHFSINVRHYLDNRFPTRWIGRDGAVRRASSSPDLTTLDFYLWRHLKSNVYKSPINEIDELKMRIHMEMNSISKGTLTNAFFKYCKKDESTYFSR